MFARDSLLYAISGGGYAPYDSDGNKLASVKTQQAQLLVADVNDPVVINILKKKLGNDVQKYHFSRQLPPSGFSLITSQNNQLFIAGGNQLFWFDTSQPAEPQLMSVMQQRGSINDLIIENNLLFVATNAGLAIYTIGDNAQLEEIGFISSAVLKGIVSKTIVDGADLWLVLSTSRELVSVDIASGGFTIEQRIKVTDQLGKRLPIADAIVLDEIILVATGNNATVVAIDKATGNGLDNLNLAYLLRNGDISADKLLLQGSILNVAAGHGDLQQFNISNWLAGRFDISPALYNYYSVMGSVTDIAVNNLTLFATTAYLQDSKGQGIESPVPVGSKYHRTGGGIESFAPDGFAVIGHTPDTEGYVSLEQALEIRFNQYIEPHYFEQFIDSLITVTLNKVPVSGQWQLDVLTDGVVARFVSDAPWQNGKRYKVNIAKGLRAITNDTLEAPYQFSFIASEFNSPVITAVVPNSGVWNGGNQVTLFGENFSRDSEIRFAGKEVPQEDIQYYSPEKLTLIVPPLNEKPASNKLVSLELSNMHQHDVLNGAYTYITDPEILAIGKFNHEKVLVNTLETTFAFNSAEQIAIQAEGINRHTLIEINNQPATGVEFIRSNLVVFDLPTNTLGGLSVKLHNQDNPDVAAIDNSLSVFVPTSEHDNAVTLMESFDDQIIKLKIDELVIDKHIGNSYVNLFTHTLPSKGKLLAIQKDTVAVLLDDNSVVVYRANDNAAYALHNRIQLPTDKTISALVLQQNTLAMFADGEVLITDISGQSYQTLEGAYKALTFYDDFVISIKDGSLVALRASDLASEVVIKSDIPTYAEKLHIEGNRLYVMAPSELALYDLSHVIRGQMSKLAVTTSLGTNNKLSINGELLSYFNGEQFVLADLNIGDQALNANVIASVDVDLNATHVMLFDDQICGLIRGEVRCGSTIVSNLIAAQTNLITRANQSLYFAIKGDESQWRNSSLSVTQDGNDVAGRTEVFDGFIGYTPHLPGFIANAAVKIELHVYPQQNIDGGQVVFDLPNAFTMHPLFTDEPVSLDYLSPNTTITGRETHFTLFGDQLFALERLVVGGQTLLPADFEVNNSGTQLTFTRHFDNAGVNSITAYQGAETASLIAGLNVTDAISVDTLTSNNARGADLVSDTQRNEITLKGKGLTGDIQVYFLADELGDTISDSNKVEYRNITGGIVFNTPNTLPGTVYHVEIVKPSTQEHYKVAQRLTAIDDTAPIVTSTSIAFNTQDRIAISFNDDMVVGSFSVSKENFDYNTQMHLDVSDNFTVAVENKRLILSPVNGYRLQDNAIYTVVINGISDTDANTVEDYNKTNVTIIDGQLVLSHTTFDSLPPRSISLQRVADQLPMTPAMTLTRGRTYEFEASAIDNLTSDVRYTLLYAKDGVNFVHHAQSIGDNKFSLFIDESFEQLGVRLKVSDRNDNVATAPFSAAIIEPQVNVSEPILTPTKAEELSASSIQFKVFGDFDLVNSTTMMLHNKWYRTTYHQMLDHGLVTLNFVNPSLAQIAPEQNVGVVLKAELNYAGSRTFNSSYRLYKDATPPTVSIVTPKMNDKFPIGEVADVVIQSFDKYGVEKVEVSINEGPFETVETANLYQFTPETESQVTIQARANDPNGNIGYSEVVSVRAFDPTKGEPELRIISPNNGEYVREGQQVELTLLMRHIEKATLAILVGAEKTDPRNPEPIEIVKPHVDVERFNVTIKMPYTSEDLVVLLALEGEDYVARSFVNVVKDDSLEENIAVKVWPNDNVLSGLAMHIQGQRPQSMVDYSDESTVVVTDSNNSTETLAMDTTSALWQTGIESGQVKVSSTLKDVSGNEKKEEFTIQKHDYVNSSRNVLASFNDKESYLVDVASFNNQPITLQQRTNHGFEIKLNDTTVYQRPNTVASKLYHSGGHYFVEYRENNQQFIAMFDPNERKEITRSAIHGDVLSVEQNLVAIQQGNVLLVKHFSRNGVVEFIGYQTAQQLKDAVFVRGKLWLLTDGQLTELAADYESLSWQRVTTYQHAVTSPISLVANQETIYITEGNAVHAFELNQNQELVKLGDFEELGVIHAIDMDNAGRVWLKVQYPIQSPIWYVLKQDKSLGALDWQYDLTFTNKKLWLHSQSELAEYSVVKALKPALSLVVERKLGGVAISGFTSLESFAELTIVNAQGGHLISSWADDNTLFIANNELTDATQLTIYIDGDITNGYQIDVPADSGLTNDQVNWNLSQSIVNTAIVPTVATFKNTMAFVPFTFEGSASSMATESSVAGWTTVTTSKILNLSNGSTTFAPFTLDVLENTVPQGQLLISNPQNNSQFTEGDWVSLEVLASGIDLSQFKHVEVTLQDFNKVDLLSFTTNSVNANTAFKVPAVDRYDIYTIRVRAYFEQSYNYIEKSVGIKVVPLRQSLDANIQGVGNKIYSNSLVTLSTDIPQHADFKVSTLNGTIIASGVEPVSFAVPNDIDSFTIEALLKDGLGNETKVDKQVAVAQPYQLIKDSPVSPFEYQFSIANNQYTINHSKLYKDGLPVSQFDGNVLDAKLLQDRLLIALEGLGIAFMSWQDDYAILGIYPSQIDFKALAIYEQQVFAISDAGNIIVFDIKGNSLEPSAQQLPSGTLAQQVVVANDGIWVTYQDTLTRFNHELEVDLSFELSAEVAHSVVHNGHLIAFDELGGLYRIDNGRLSQHQLTVMAINAVSSLGNELFAYDGLANELLIISLNEATPYVIYRENIQSDISDLFVSNGVITSNNGDVWTLNQNQNAPYRQLFTSNKHKGSSEHIVLHNGSAIVAEKTYALTQYTGLPSHARRSFFPSEYASEFSALILDNTDIYAFDKVSGYLYQVNTAQLSGSQHLGKFASNSMFSTDENYLYAATSDQLTIISKDDFEQRYTFTVAAGEVITALKATPTEVYVATLDGTIYRVSHPGLPMEEFALRVDSVIATNSVIEEINTLGDTLVLTSRTELSSYNLSENIYQTILSNKVQDVVIKGQSVLYALDNEIFEHKLSSNTPDKLMYQAKADIAGFAISKDQLAVALGVNGVELAWRGEQPSQLVADLTKPANKTHFVHGQAIDLAVAHSADLVSVDYYVNDALVARSEHFPFSVQIPIPGELRNGNEFTVHAVTKDRIGNSVVGNKRTMLLHSQDLPQNNFNVELLYRNPSYVPAPLKIEALVKNATQDIRQVEFYLSDDESGPYKLIRKHYGPEFIVRNNFTLAQSGQFIKARAIDVYGNVTESQPTVIQRHLDDEVPQVSLSLESPLNDAKRVTTTYPYGIAFNVSDTGSAINLALLKRDNTVIWAGFTDTQSRIEQHAKNTGDTYVYSLEVSDNANNTNSTSLNVEVVEDERPVVNDISVPNAVLEQSAFEVTMNVQDDIEVAYIEVQRPNFVKRYPVNERQINKTLSIQDTRSLRVNSDKNETLTLLIVDSKGQQTRVEKSITVTKDKAPQPKLSNLSFADAAIYGSKLNGKLIDLNLVDDGLLRELAVDLLIYQGGELKVAKPICDINRNIVCRETMNASINIPSTTVANDQIHIALRAIDKLGQVTVSDQHAILLSQVPNAIVLTDEFDSANLSLAKVGVPAEFAFRVKDLANRSVALQGVDLVISQRDSAQKISNSVITDSNGVAYFSVDTSDLVVSEYVAEATLRDYPNILPAIVRFEVLPGEPSAIRVEHIAPIRANETANLMLELVDAAGNKATNVPNANVALVFNHPGFHFAFDPNVHVEPYYQGENYVGEKALITLVGGKANIEFQATEVMGEYVLARLSDNLADVGLSYQSEQDGSYQISADIPLNVTANVPARLVMSLSAMSNDISGREDVLEQTETATLQLQLTDEFGNQITEIDGQPANGEVNVFVSGDATFANDTNQFVVALNNGAATFTVTNNTVEEVIISVTNIANSLNIDAESDLTLNFARLLARVVDTKLVQVVDLDITPLEVKFNEPVSLTSGFAWPTVSLQGVNVEGEFSFDDDVTLRFIPNQPLTLGAVYELSTHGTAIVSNETQETIFASHYEFTGPDLSLPEQTLGYLLSEQTSTLTLALADNYTWDQINELNFISDDLSLAVNAQTHELIAPVIAEQDEGKQIVASVSARIQETSLFVANARTFTLLTQAGDFDGDGISNDLEHQLGYHPLKQDSDGNGVSDANEDYDNDGLSNALEIQLGGKIDNADSDDDGVNDGTEYQWGSDINNADTDGDGIDDAIEIASGSDPTDANDRAIKPELVIGIDIAQDVVTHNLAGNGDDVIFTIIATVSINDRTYTIDVSDANFYDLVFESLDESIVIPSYRGFTPIALGEAEVRVHFGAYSDTAKVKVVEVISLGDVIWQDESVEFTGTVFANSITIRGRVDAFVAGDLVIENDLTVEQGALSKVASNTLEVKGDANILGELMVLKSEGDNSLYIREHHKVYDFNQDNLVARLNITESNIDKFVQIRFKVPPTGGHGSLPEFDNTYSFSGTAQIQCDEKYQRAFEGKYDADFAVFIVTCPLTELGEYTLNVEGNVEGSMMISDISSEHLYFSNEGQVVSFYDDLPPGMFELFIDNLGERSDRRLELFSDYRNSINMTNLQTGGGCG